VNVSAGNNGGIPIVLVLGAHISKLLFEICAFEIKEVAIMLTKTSNCFFIICIGLYLLIQR
jgi:membrane protein CcdC involved in cytochrome C biogenesis